MDVKLLIPDGVREFLEFNNSEKTLVPINDSSNFLFVNSPDLVKSVLHIDSNNYTRDTGLKYWRSLNDRFPFCDFRLLRLLNSRGYESVAFEKSLTTFLNINQQITEEALFLFLFDYFIHPYSSKVATTVKLNFHRASIYFEETRALNGFGNGKSRALHEISRLSLSTQLLKAMGAEDVDLEYSEGVDLFAAFLHAGYRSLLNNFGWILVFSDFNKNQFRSLWGNGEWDERRTGNFVKEVLRLTPSGWNLHRVATRDCNLGKLHLTAGCELQISPLCFHWNEKYFNNPLGFDPSRFDGHIEAWTYFPFGGGEFKCPGASLSLELSKSFLKLVSQSFIVEANRVANYPNNYGPISLNPFKIFEFVLQRN